MTARWILAALYAGVFSLLATVSAECIGAEAIETPVPIRVGWQIPAVTQAAIVQVLK